MAKRRRVARHIQTSYTNIDKLLDGLHKRKDEVEDSVFNQINHSWPHSHEVISFYFDLVSYFEENFTK